MSNFEEAHVLVVDDSSFNCRLIERLLKNFSCKVTAVDSGLRALQLLEVDGLKVDMIITDYCMPNMTGYELLKKIKESSNFKEIPVVIMSSENVLTRKNKCLEEGAKDFIMKPVTISDFKKLKVYMKKDVGVEESEINKRKLQESFDQSPSPPSILPQTFSAPSTSSFSAPSSPTSFDSQIKQLKRTCSWSQGGWSNLPWY